VTLGLNDDRPVALLVGLETAVAFPVVGDTIAPPGATASTRGHLPARAAPPSGGRPVAWMVTALGTPRVTVVGSFSAHGRGETSANEIVKAGGVLAGWALSGTELPPLLRRELAHQAPDVIVVATEHPSSLWSVLREPAATGAPRPPVPVIYSGPPDGAPPDMAGNRLLISAPIPSIESGEVAPRALHKVLKVLVREHLARHLDEAGYGDVPATTLGDAALRAVRLARATLAPPLQECNAHGTPADVCLVVAQEEHVSVFALWDDDVDAVSGGLLTHGTVDLWSGAGRERGPVEARFPDWHDLAGRLPFPVGPVELSNIVATHLAAPGYVPDNIGDACVAGALTEWLLARAVAHFRVPGCRPGYHPARPRVLVGTGPGLSRLQDPHLAAYHLVNGFQPRGVCQIAIDPWCTLLLEAAAPRPVTALSLQSLGVVVSPLAAAHDWDHPFTDPWAIVSLERDDGQPVTRRLLPGTVTGISLPAGRQACLTIEPCRADLDFGAGPGLEWTGRVTGGSLGIILDGRGRPLKPPGEPELRMHRHRKTLLAMGVHGPTPGDAATGRVTAGTLTERREASAPGEP